MRVIIGLLALFMCLSASVTVVQCELVIIGKNGETYKNIDVNSVFTIIIEGEKQATVVDNGAKTGYDLIGYTDGSPNYMSENKGMVLRINQSEGIALTMEYNKKNPTNKFYRCKY